MPARGHRRHGRVALGPSGTQGRPHRSQARAPGRPARDGERQRPSFVRREAPAERRPPRPAPRSPRATPPRHSPAPDRVLRHLASRRGRHRGRDRGDDRRGARQAPLPLVQRPRRRDAGGLAGPAERRLRGDVRSLGAALPEGHQGRRAAPSGSRSRFASFCAGVDAPDPAAGGRPAPIAPLSTLLPRPIEEEGLEVPESRKDRDDEAPDLFVVDGGRGQLAVALAAAHDLGMHDLAIVALAKERETVLGEALTDRVYLPGQKNPIPLKSSTTSLFLLARLLRELRGAPLLEPARACGAGRKGGASSRRHFDDVKGLGANARRRPSFLEHRQPRCHPRRRDDAALPRRPSGCRCASRPGPCARRTRRAAAGSGRATTPHDSGPMETTPTAETERQRS